MRQLNTNEIENISGGIISPGAIAAAAAAAKAGYNKAEAWLNSGGVQRLVTRLSGTDG